MCDHHKHQLKYNKLKFSVVEFAINTVQLPLLLHQLNAGFTVQRAKWFELYSTPSMRVNVLILIMMVDMIRTKEGILGVMA